MRILGSIMDKLIGRRGRVEKIYSCADALLNGDRSAKNRAIIKSLNTKDYLEFKEVLHTAIGKELAKNLIGEMLRG